MVSEQNSEEEVSEQNLEEVSEQSFVEEFRRWIFTAGFANRIPKQDREVSKQIPNRFRISTKKVSTPNWKKLGPRIFREEFRKEHVKEEFLIE